MVHKQRGAMSTPDDHIDPGVDGMITRNRGMVTRHRGDHYEFDESSNSK